MCGYLVKTCLLLCKTLAYVAQLWIGLKKVVDKGLVFFVLKILKTEEKFIRFRPLSLSCFVTLITFVIEHKKRLNRSV